MSIGFLQKIILKEKYTEEDIIKTELEIIQKLNFDLNYDTIVNYSQYLVSKINIKQDIKKKIIQACEFTNILSQNFDEIVFDKYPLTLAFITLKASIELLYINDEIDEVTYIDIYNEFYNIMLLSSSSSNYKYQKQIMIVNSYSTFLINAFVNNKLFFEQKEYYKSYLSIFE